MGVGDLDLALQLVAAVNLGLEVDGLDGGGDDVAGRAHEAAGLLQRQAEVAQGGGQAGDHQVADGVALEVALGEAVLEGPGPDAVGVAQCDQAAAQVTGGGDAEGGAEAAARAAVVGDRDNGGDGAGVAAGGLEGGSQAVPAAQGDDFWSPHLSMSRWFTTKLYPIARMRAAISSAMTTERWCPPVQPAAIDRYDFPSST